MDIQHRRGLAAALGARIAAARQQAGATQAALAERIGVGEEAVSRIERGAVTPTLPRLLDIAEALGLSTGELLMRASPRPDDQAAAMARDLARLSPRDRELVAQLVSLLIARLAPPNRKRPRRR